MTVKIRDTDSGTVLATIQNWPAGAMVPRPGDRLRVRGRVFVIETGASVFDVEGNDQLPDLTVTVIARRWNQSPAEKVAA